MSLQDTIDRYPTVIDALRANPGGHPFPYPLWWTSWRDEQHAWAETAILFNQSFHMSDLFISGPDTLKLLSDTSVNRFDNFATGRAKQYVAVNEEGYLVGDSILVKLSDDLVTLAGFEYSLNWLQYHAQRGGYDVSFEREQNSDGSPHSKRLYRYEIEGPLAWQILQKAAGTPLEHIKFFHVGEITIAGRTVKALNHTMGGVPGQESTGLELFGPEEDTEAVVNAILDAGQEYGLKRGGALSYASTTAESGWVGGIVPAIYTSPSLADYRRWLPDGALENFNLGFTWGSYDPDSIEGYYLTPWDLGYGHIIKFDHEFIGRDALQKLADAPARQKAWLVWNEEDTRRVLADGELGTGPDAPKLLPWPMSPSWDRIELGGELVGFTQLSGFTVNLRGWVSVGSIATEHAVDGTEVELVWGDSDGGAGNPMTEPHTATRIRATVRLSSPIVR